ncbi:MAG: hypothetical protein ABSG72_22900 [Candidatus Sulfotelmatobacter sp.]|jgi:hypothetical protein
MKLKLDRIISLATLAASLIAIVLVLKRPAPVVQPQTSAATAEHTQSTDQKIAQPQQQPTQSSSASGAAGSRTPQAAQPASKPGSSANPKVGTQVNSDEISSVVAQMLGATAGNASLSPDSNLGSGAPNIKDQQVTMDGDIVHGRFLTEIAGKQVWVTISGHMGEKDGFATFDPTEFKVGDMDVPVSLVNPALQRKLAEERDRLKIPNNGASQ